MWTFVEEYVSLHISVLQQWNEDISNQTYSISKVSTRSGCFCNFSCFFTPTSIWSFHVSKQNFSFILFWFFLALLFVVWKQMKKKTHTQRSDKHKQLSAWSRIWFLHGLAITFHIATINLVLSIFVYIALSYSLYFFVLQYACREYGSPLLSVQNKNLNFASRRTVAKILRWNSSCPHFSRCD